MKIFVELIFAKVKFCSKHLCDDKSLLLFPGLSGHNVVDHHLGHIIYINAYIN